MQALFELYRIFPRINGSVALAVTFAINRHLSERTREIRQFIRRVFDSYTALDSKRKNAARLYV